MRIQLAWKLALAHEKIAMMHQEYGMWLFEENELTKAVRIANDARLPSASRLSLMLAEAKERRIAAGIRRRKPA